MDAAVGAGLGPTVVAEVGAADDDGLHVGGAEGEVEGAMEGFHVGVAEGGAVGAWLGATCSLRMRLLS